MTKKEMRIKAQDIIMSQIAHCGYVLHESDYLDILEEDKELMQVELKKQMDRVAKLFGFDEAWFS